MIVVTGSTGTIGRLLVRACVAREAKVRVMARDVAKAAALFGDSAPIVAGDFTD